MNYRRGNIKKNTITLEEAQSASKRILDSLFKARSQLRHIVAKHETTLQNRWLKKSPKQRTEILLQTWPKMSRVHRPDLDLLRKERKTRGYHQRDIIATDIALRFPHLNTEDLSLPKPLLLMLESRSRNSPYVFVGADFDAIQVGIRSNMLVPKYVRGYTMYLSGESRDEYGRISWTEDRQAYSTCYKGMAPAAGMGIVILESQRDILEFLVVCSLRILHIEFPTGLNGLPVNSSSDTWIPQRTLNAERKPSRALANGDNSITVHAFEALYRSPDACDFARLKTFLEARCQEVADQFFLIREDPAYFAELMWEACSHTREATVNRQFDPYSTRLSDSAWNEALSQVLLTAYHDAFLWRTVKHLFDQLMMTYTEQRTNIRHGRFLPAAYVEALVRLNYVLNIIPRRNLALVPHYMAAIPTFKAHIAVTYPADGELVVYIRKNPADYLFWLFTELAKEEDDREIWAGQDISLEIDNLISNDVRQKGRLDWRLIRVISDLAVVAEIQRQLKLSTCNETVYLPYSKEEIVKWIKTSIEPLPKIRDIFWGTIGGAQSNGFPPLVTDLRVFDYPSDKPRTAANVAKMRSAEQALDVLWEKIDKRFVRETGKSLEELGKGKIQHRDVKRTPPWTDPQHSNIDEGKDKSAEALDVSLALSTLEERTESTIDPTQPSAVRDKVKTRGLPIDNTQSEEPESSIATEQCSTGLKLFVRKKAFNTFATLFGKPLLANKIPGELPWTNFKKAMVNVGFSAEKLQGSAWLFASERSSIIFHEPHPQSKLPMQWARRIARRLNRNFGWTAETFVLDDGADNENINSMTC